jgi:hypothetical protein
VVSGDRNARLLAGAVLAGLILLSACGDDAAPVVPSSPTSVPLGALPQHVVDSCLEVAALTAGCPRMAPQTTSPYRSRSLDFGTALYRVIEFSSGAPYPRIGPRNAPPRSAHVVVKGGDLSMAFPFRWPSDQAPEEIPADPDSRGDDPVLLGRYEWGETAGTLVLAPAFPVGGVDGDHLIYRWSRGDTEYSISLHAWTPVQVAIRTLRAIVESTSAAAP